MTPRPSAAYAVWRYDDCPQSSTESSVTRMNSLRHNKVSHANGSWLSKFGLLDQYLTPHYLLTRCMQRLTRVQAPWFKDRQIQWFVRHYQVDMSIAAQTNPLAYPDFNSFFTRALKPDARPVVSEEHAIACPADGIVSQLGDVESGRLLQAKGHYFDLLSLLGGSQTRAQAFQNSRFVTIYLSPRDYHRVHMPLRGRLREMAYIPGRLYSVSPRTTQAIPGLFARNERLVSLFDTAIGLVAVILVGAMFVAGIETVWSGLIAHSKRAIEWDFDEANKEQKIILERGAELGRFNMGSTVIVLFPPDRIELAPSLIPNAPVKMGELLATTRPSDQG
jgi:phosphatidylserine decarboxylase